MKLNLHLDVVSTGTGRLCAECLPPIQLAVTKSQKFPFLWFGVYFLKTVYFKSKLI